MLKCIDKTSLEFQTLKNRSGIDEFKVEAYCRSFFTKYNRFPNLDEIPGANSLNYFKLLFQLNDKNATDINIVLEKTGTDNMEDAIIEINKSYSDYETYILPLGNRVIINQIRKPIKYSIKEKGEVDINPTNFIIFNNALEKFALLYGINIIPISSEEINNDKELSAIPGIITSKAFVYNGNVYLNTDLATIDSKIHELLHIFLGSLRTYNSDLYLNLISSVENFSDYKFLISQFPNRTRSDINEELFVSELAKYLSGLESSKLTNLSELLKYELFYNITKMLDTMLLGEATTKSIDKSELCTLSLKDIAEKVNSSAFNNTFKGSLNDALVHRISANIKELLMKEKKLLEVCDL